MEQKTELKKLVNVLRRTARMALQAEWTGGQTDTAPYCAEQYNRVLARLSELDENVSKVFSPLPEGSSLSVIAMACRQLSAYYEEELGGERFRGWGGPKGFAFGHNPEAFKDFWRKSAHEFEELGEFIRESIEEWFKAKKKEHKEEKTTSEEKKE